MMISSFTFRTSLLLLLVIGSAGFIGSCKNPTAPREPNKFASQATFIRQLDSIRVNNSTILLSGGVARNALSLPSGDLLFVGEVQRPGSLFRSALVIRTNALGVVRWANLYTDSIETLRSIVPMSNGEFIVSGSVFSGNNQTSGYMLRIDSLGNTRFSRSYRDSINSTRFFGAVLQDNDRVLFYGQSVQRNRAIADGCVYSVSIDGNLISSRVFSSLGSRLRINRADIGFTSGIDFGQRAILGGFYTPIARGEGIPTTLLATDTYIIRLEENGDTTQFIYDYLSIGGDVSFLTSLQAKLNTTDEALSFAPSRINPNIFYTFARTNSIFYIMELNKDPFNFVRNIIIPENNTATLSQFATTLDGNFIFVGTSTQKITFDGLRSPAPGGTDVYIAKYSSQGNLLWEITQGTSLGDEGLTIKQTIDDGYIITGTSSDKPLLLKVDERGLLAE